MDSMEKLNSHFWKNKRVFLTGHTGFKGAWLRLWLTRLGAQVFSYSLPPHTVPSLHDLSESFGGGKSWYGDIRDLKHLSKVMEESDPEIIFHLAARALVRESYKNPLDTISTNVLGTANLLEVARGCRNLKSVVIVTTDKCYENLEKGIPFLESDPLGGKDPYSASKACAEIVSSSFYQSFFQEPGLPVVATARAGNVYGGGDWSDDRLVPDCIRSFKKDEPVILRNPLSTRPWQFVLDPIFGYLILAEKLAGESSKSFAGAWNFGPDKSSEVEVGLVADLVAKQWGEGSKVVYGHEDVQKRESHFLTLNSDKACNELGWKAKVDLQEGVAITVDWYKSYYNGSSILPICLEAIDKYSSL